MRTTSRDGVRIAFETAGHGHPLVLLLAGDRDRQLPAIRRTAARIPGATLVELPDCGHLDAFLRVDLTLPVVRPFLTASPGEAR